MRATKSFLLRPFPMAEKNGETQFLVALCVAFFHYKVLLHGNPADGSSSLFAFILYSIVSESLGSAFGI